MFQKNDHQNHAMDTIIGSSVQVEGNFVGKGNIIIEGEVRGNIKTSQNIEAGEGSKIIADVTSTNALISGEVQGNLTITERLELTSTAKINGNIEAGIIIVAGGASINGQCKIGTGKISRVETDSDEDEEE